MYALVGVMHSVEIAEKLAEFLSNPPVRKMLGERRYVGPQSSSQIHRRWAWTGQEENEKTAPAVSSNVDVPAELLPAAAGSCTEVLSQESLGRDVCVI